jgi:hypothetical protein
MPAILALAAALGAALPSRAAPVTGMLPMPLGSDTLFVYKAADGKHRPRGDYFGKAEFDSAAKRGPRILIHILVPGNTPPVIPAFKQGLSLTLVEGGRETPLAQPLPIFRMPETPFRSFAIVESAGSAALVARDAAGDSAVLDLKALRKLPPRWSRKPAQQLSEEPPASLYGKTP